MNVQILSAGEKDLPRIREMAIGIWKAYYPAIITMEQIEYMLEKNYSVDSLLKQMHEGQEFYLITDDKKEVGFISISPENENLAFINKFYIDTQVHSKGLGSEAFALVQQRYPGFSFRLQVNRQNYKAINFYFKEGFMIEKVADFDIGNGYFMNDFLMLKKA